jgi:phage terminase large subunit-like protein
VKDHPAEIYAREAAAGRIACSRWVRLAAKRHLRDLEDAPGRGLRFNVEAGQRAIDFFGFLRHSKGEWNGKAFQLEPWQAFIVWSIFGWKRKDGLRRFRSAYVEVPRKNGKSTLCAGIGLYLFFADDEGGAEVYCAATKKDQARIVFEEAVKMRASSPSLAKRIVKNRDNMHTFAGQKFEPLGADEDTLDGLNIHGYIVDELHAHKSRGLLDVLDTATGARRQPLGFKITTAGFNRESICWKEHEYGTRILEQVIEDDSTFVYIACLDDGDDWELEKNWQKANPNYDISVKVDDLRRKALKAAQEPTALNSFLRLHLNQWTQQETRWMPLDKWNACVGESLAGVDAKVLREQMAEKLAGRRCFGGLDLSSKIDLTAWVLLFPPSEDDPRWIVLPRFWIPDENVLERVKKDRVQYDVWIREGFISTTEGNVVDYDEIRAAIVRDRQRYDLVECAFDPWNATQLAVDLGKDAVKAVEFRQGYASMSGPTNELMALVVGRKLAHLANPVLRWQAGNLVVKQDEAGNVKPDKAKSSEKIDGIVGLVMALGRAIATPAKGRSIYETRGIEII